MGRWYELSIKLQTYANLLVEEYRWNNLNNCLNLDVETMFFQ